MGNSADKRKLYQISHDMDRLADFLIECGGDVSDPEVAARVDAALRADSEAFSKKADSYVALIREFEARGCARRIEADRMKQLQQVDLNAARNLKERLMAVMEHQGMKRVDTDRFRVTLAANGGKRPLVIVGEVPQEFCRVEVKPDTDKIREAIEAGHELPFVEVGDRGKHLRIA